MKTPQRKFVVEFKSPRRQSKSPANSIWGDTDLKALAREVEDQQADLSYPGHARHSASTGAVTSPVKVDTHSVDEPAVATDLAQIASAATGNSATGLPELNAEQPEAASVGATQEDLHSSRPRKISKRTPQRRARRGQPARNSKDQSEQSKIAAEPLTLDAIAALEAENKRLRQLLVEHLRDQNLRLKQMLERFDLS
ncbi:hypothetical protein J1C56_31980 [Aminobacter anthyllidis]|uniref:Uncharacterized protein n=1 Tax=Aminobacter anthyllidis TaxID=1035067 RepID=A0A9X1AIL1_9HYPH|nr:hypothetical protein [Aminobacter anthyllidis]MBT1160151.1 hypothetical protein [Aminobacter anthyllidis]